MARDSVITTVFTVIWVVGVFLIGLPYLIVSRSPDYLSFNRKLLRVLGVPFVFIGAGLYLWSTRDLTDPGGTPVPTHEPEDLVIGGPYRYTRNPFYVSVLCVLLGEALIIGHIGLIAYTGLMWGYFQLLVVGYEEPRLHRKYGKSYEEYRRKVPRWVRLSMLAPR